MGLIFAQAIEESNLHRRIALNAMSLMGTSPRYLMIGFMIPTSLISMWISNVATTAMMLPTLEAVLEVLEENTEADIEYGDIIEPEGVESTTDLTIQQRKKSNIRKLRALFALSVCYAANVGGTGTLIGTSPNLVFMEFIQDFPGQPVNFGTWMAFSLPQVILSLILIWLWLQVRYLGFPNVFQRKRGHKRGSLGTDQDNKDLLAIRNLIRQKCNELGPITYHEGSVMCLFVVLLLLWFFRDPGFMPGWGELFKTSNQVGDAISVSDATPTMLVVVLLFILPSKPNFIRALSSRGNRLPRIEAQLKDDKSRGNDESDNSVVENGPEDKDERETSYFQPSLGLVTWRTVHEKMPWNVLLLLGGGFAMATASERSCLSPWIGQKLTALQGLPDWAICVVVTLLMSVITQIASNVAATTMLLPVLRNLSLILEINPIYLMLPPTLTASYAFMLPVSTGPNAIAFIPSRITTFEMVKVGFVMNVLCLIVIHVCINTYGTILFDLDEFPDWALSGSMYNTTNMCASQL
ncbi:Na(+)/citrate cotransporter-like isoform X2 [Tigriopus californicus]|uniref:Na(+)/citrate cotransporter-like isoform X2 n=1 Tax=Tigriopus californicus TaxID=6832 RepID=UPI0027DA2ABB|nr:Na(+)/citrate cotransporter-like isoform X2 [Tigriopus californicus]